MVLVREIGVEIWPMYHPWISVEILERLANVRVGLNEYYSGFRHIGHNDPLSLVFLWLIPK